MTSSVDSHNVPSFYACYLMRSYATASSSRTYIGSTPDPIRRKKQHNGILTQGAHKTMRGRPWETQMIIWGFPSKIAALQFEWAWQKPYLSRHLRTHGQPSEPSSTSSTAQQQHLPLPLFTDTPLNQIPVSADGCKGLSCTSVQSNLLVARALLRSEPFSTWNLRITFFEEYCWAAWLRVEADLIKGFSLSSNREQYRTVGLHHSRSRLDRPLPPGHLAPAPICDFTGVDGSKKSLLMLGDEEKNALKLDDKRSKTVQEGRSPGQWPEKLPKTLTVKAMGATWDALRKAPMAVILGGENQCGSYSKMKLNDDDQGEISWKRYQNVLKERDVALEAVRSSSEPSSNTTRQCNLCKGNITLQQHLTYTTCPSSFTQLQPQSAVIDSSTLSQYGFGSRENGDRSNRDIHCQSLFHIQCLAQHFTAKQSSHDKLFILPSHGWCPCCGVEGKAEHLNTWIEVIRGVFRRSERVEKEIVKAEVAKAREEKMMQKMAMTKKKRSTTASKLPSSDADNVPLSKRDGLLGALDEIQNKPNGKRSFQPVSKLLRDPIHSPPSTLSTPPIATLSSATTLTAKRSSLLCNLDSLLNTPSQESAVARSVAKRPKQTSIQEHRLEEVIDLT